MNRSKALIVIACGAFMVLLSMGIRQSFGIFLQPITSDLAIGRESFSLAVAIQNIIFGLPIIGILADRYGARWIALTSALLYVVGLGLLGIVGSPTSLTLTLGVLIGVALSGTTYVVILGAVAQVVPAAKRSLAFGIITAVGSFGMFAMVPVSQQLLTAFGWRGAVTGLAVIVSGIILLVFALPSRPKATISKANAALDEEAEPMLQVLQKAWRNSSYWLLIAGFFVCGFHVAFIATHLPAFLSDSHVTGQAAALALSMIGLGNIVGSFSFGYLGDHYRKKYLLSALYFARAIVIALFVFLPISNSSAIAFGAAIGFLWLGTVPLTSGAIGQIFGIRYLATLYGFVFFSHQIGAFLGVWLGGRVYDSTGSYGTIWLAAIALGLFAALVHLPIRDVRPTPVVRAVVAGEAA
ncbi:MAG TPA: MFS transporter [Caldilineaceae bacterium]|nr:MFS transporter [Caldilineaceae bacterium]